MERNSNPSQTLALWVIAVALAVLAIFTVIDWTSDTDERMAEAEERMVLVTDELLKASRYNACWGMYLTEATMYGDDYGYASTEAVEGAIKHRYDQCIAYAYPED